eukprot:scaffold6107_cov130-Isochrysis_galbana.AAC.7
MDGSRRKAPMTDKDNRYILSISVTPEELSAPDSYSGSPTSYSGAENTEELLTPPTGYLPE